MNPLVVLSALLAVAAAAPGAYLAAGPAVYSGLHGCNGLGLHGCTYNYAPGAVAYSNLNAAVPAPLPTNGLSPGLGALVKKTAIVAAGRPVTSVQAHVKRVEPEITHTQVNVDVPVARHVAVPRPVAVPAPYPVTPVVEHTEVVQPVVRSVVQPVVHQAVGYTGYSGLAHGYTGLAHGYAAGYNGLAHGYAAGYNGLAHGYAAGYGLGYNGYNGFAHGYAPAAVAVEAE